MAKQMSASLRTSPNMTSISHNTRKMSDKEKERNAHVDFEKSHENVILVDEPIREKYEEMFGEALMKYNAKQKRKDRVIDDYYAHVKKSETLDVQREIILQIGTYEDYNLEKKNGDPTGLTEREVERNRETANVILKKYFEGFEKRNPNFEVYCCVIHNDEKSPHMHLNFIPKATGYKRGLEVQPSFSKALENQGYEKGSDFKTWRADEVKTLEKLMREHEIERVEVGTHDYIPPQKYKEVMAESEALESKNHDLRVAIKSSERKLETKKQVLDEVEDEIKHKDKVLEVKKDEVAVANEKVQKQLNLLRDMPEMKMEKIEVETKPVMFNKEKETIDVDVRKELQRLASQAQAERSRAVGSLNLANRTIKANSELRAENERLKAENKTVNEVKKERDFYERKSINQEVEIRSLKGKNKKLEKENKSLKEQLKNVYDYFDKNVIAPIIAHIPMFRVFKEDEERPHSLRETLMMECVYNLADDPKNYYKKSTWQQELKSLATYGRAEKLAYFDDSDTFYRQHKRDIHRLSPTGNVDEAVRKMAGEIYNSTMSTGLVKTFIIPPHPNPEVTPQSVKPRSRGWDMER